MNKDMPRVCLVGHRKGLVSIFERLRAQTQGFEVVLTLGKRRGDIDLSTIFRTVGGSNKPDICSDHQNYHGVLKSVFAAEDSQVFYRSLFQFIDHMMRWSQAERRYFQGHSVENIHEYMNYFHIIYENLAKVLVEKEVDTMVFFDVPHAVFDTVAYHVAKFLKIRTVILEQSHLPGCFFSAESTECFGHIDFSKVADHCPAYSIDQEMDQTHFYMPTEVQQPAAAGNLTVRDVVLFFVYLIARERRTLFDFKELGRCFSRAKAIKKRFPKWRDPFARFFHRKHLDYFESLMHFESREIDFSCDYVYFPLQLQPEATTSALGDMYLDQALALEHLSQLIPEGYKIYVKENPRQQSTMRDPLFFHRLRRIPSVVVMPSYANTHQLLNHSCCVATITGTAGWEAICKGKPVITFGGAWYRSLPGAFEFSPQLDFNDVINFCADHQLLESRVGQLLSTVPRGVVYDAFAAIYPEYDDKKNVEVVSDYIADLVMRRRPVVFSQVG